MFKKITQKFKDDRKYFSIVFFVLIIFAASSIITESVINKTNENWNSRLVNKISEIQESIKKDFNNKQDDILQKLNIVRQDLRLSLKPENESYKELVRLINDDLFDNYSIEIFAPNGKLIAWNQVIAIDQDELFPLSFSLGETYFLSKDLITYLSIIDTAQIEADVFYLAISAPIEDNYAITNQYSGKTSFQDFISKKYQIVTQIDYTPYSEKSKDGRYFSFELTNASDNKIGMVSFQKPLLTYTVNQIKETSSKIQSLLLILALLFVGIGLKGDFKKVDSLLLRFTLLIIYLTILRVIIFLAGFPSNLVTGVLTDSSNFSSAFGWGIVKSPIEFFTTVVFITVISIQFFRYTRKYLYSARKIKIKILGYVSSLLLSIGAFLLIRALSAIIRSIIFDSTIRYFKEPNILPDLLSLGMNLNMLLIAFSILLVLVGLLNIIFKFLGFDSSNFKKTKLLFTLFIVGLMIFTTYFFTNDPLITPFLLLIIVTLLFIVFYQVIFKSENSAYNYLLFLLIASVISISLLNYFNSKLERESLKTTALEINRVDSNLLSFMLDETLQDLKNQKDIVDIFENRYTNYDAKAFTIWAKSVMQKESLNSGIRLYDKSKKALGEFFVGIDPDNKVFDGLNKSEEIKIVELNSENQNLDKYYAGLIRINSRGITVGYISVFVSFSIKSIGAVNFPDFIESNLSILNRVLDVKQLKIFQFENKKLKQVYGDIYPSRDQIKQILQTNLDTIYNDAWVKLKFGGENYETYVLKTQNENSEIITTASVEEKAFSWNLFNFFKTFIVHSLFIIVALVILVVSRVRKINLTFKSKLLFAFLVISIIPVVVLALYNAKVVNERAREGIFSELNQRAKYVEKHLTSQLEKHKNRDILMAAQNAAKELGISFALYSSTDQIYSSKDTYDKIGLFNTKLNPQAYYNLNYLRFQEYVTSEKLNNYNFDSYYKFIRLDNKDYILSVNDAFNKIKVTFSTTEINIVIFGIYSFAVLIIILISTFFANQISQPIQRLTKATDAVSKGDLNIKIKHNEHGELKDLLDGFNQMTSELKKNQTELAELEREAAWKEMAKQVAHEIKNPLTPMKLALQQLIISYKDKSKDFDKLFEKVSNTVLNQIDNLNQIASEFSHFAKMPSLKIETLDLLVILNDTVNMFILENTKFNINTKLQTAIVDADLSQLRRMFINLIRNSIQADATKIIIEVYLENDKYKLLFTDNGKGISESDKEKVFDEHFTTKKQGMGLGLSLAKRLMKSIDGDIKLKSSSQESTTFEIIFPAKSPVSNQ